MEPRFTTTSLLKKTYNRSYLTTGDTVHVWLHFVSSTLIRSVIYICVNILRPRQNGRHFADDTFKRIFLNDNVRLSIKISLNFVPNGPIINIPALVQIMAWRRLGDKPLSEIMLVSLLTHICVTRPQCVNGHGHFWFGVKSLSGPSLAFCQLDHNEQTSV